MPKPPRRSVSGASSWTLLGFFPKRRHTREDWKSPYPEYPDAAFPSPEPVRELCSVSTCIARGHEPPESWIDGVPVGFRSASAAWDAVAESQRSEFQVLAYRLGSFIFRDGNEEALVHPDLDFEPLPRSFERLGYDAVLWGEGGSFGCSPLSCNGQARAGEVNGYCLVDSESAARDLARRFSVEKPEPGPYCVVEVWRERRVAAAANSTAR